MIQDDDVRESVSDAPFPLKGTFRRRILPGLAVFILVLVGLTALTGQWVMRSVYLELAERRADVIARAIREDVPDAWTELVAGTLGPDRPAWEGFAAVLLDEEHELGLVKLKAYDLEARLLYASGGGTPGKVEDNPAIRRILADGRSTIVPKTYPGGLDLYEFYVPVRDERGRLLGIFELYEPVDYLDGIVLSESVPLTVLPALLFLVLVMALDRLVSKAQTDIDRRTEMLKSLRARLETFVSKSAVDAARGTAAGEDIPSQRIRCTLLYSDVRDFTGFSESNSPERVVRFLNDLMGVQVAAVEAQGGDVDKMIGDALLARFDGDDAPARALAAARAIQADMDQGFLPRGVGIGLFTGDVVSGAIGPAARRDFTVIGDSVNAAARLCSAAQTGEIVADHETLTSAGAGDFGPDEVLQVKGRREGIAARRLPISQ